MSELVNFLENFGLLKEDKDQIEPILPIEEGDVVIGEMSQLEKYLDTFIVKKDNELEKLIQKSKEVENKEEYLKINEKVVTISYIVELAIKIMWTSVFLRCKTLKSTAVVGITIGFKIIEKENLFSYNYQDQDQIINLLFNKNNLN